MTRYAEPLKTHTSDLGAGIFVELDKDLHGFRCYGAGAVLSESFRYLQAADSDDRKEEKEDASLLKVGLKEARVASLARARKASRGPPPLP